MLSNPLFKIVKTFWSKLWQNPEEYPVRYYKPGRQFRSK